MSCQIKLTANIQDINAIRRCLFPTDDHRGTESWLQFCQVSVCPTGDIIAIANERRLVVLTAKWDSTASRSQFQITYSGSIHEYDKVKAVLCLPIVGQSHSSHVGPDWTCIMLGYDSGFVRFYTENCDLLFEEQLHCENITTIKCQSQHSPRPDISPDLHPEEIYVQYQSNICVINGPNLFQNLRYCRSQLAKGNLSNFTQFTAAPRKWGFQEQACINDAEVVGLNMANTFDHLMTASVCGGFESKYRAMPPHCTLVMAAGGKPFLGYHYAMEGGSQPVLSDVAKAVASKLKSALPGWLTGGKSQPEKQMTTAMHPVDAMGCRFGLCDIRRTACNIALSPDRKLAAVSDALGRVLLIDSFRGVTLRVFKGYREAQCAFIQVPDERKSKHRHGNKVALFLVIYSAKKGTLEIFSVQQGTKITTFTASKHSRLVYISYGLMGFNTMQKSKYVCQFTTLLIDNDGQIKEIMVPFHFALTEKNNKRAKDIHLYKKLRQLIKSGEFNDEKLAIELFNTYSELKTTEIRLQLIEMILGSKEVPAEMSLDCVQYFVEKLTGEDPEEVNLRILSDNAAKLIRFYLFLTKVENLDALNGNESEEFAPLDTKLHLGAKELSNLQKLLDLSTINDNEKSKEAKVSFRKLKSSAFSEFVAAFNLTNATNIALKPNLDEKDLFNVSEIIFKNYIAGLSTNYAELRDNVLESKLVIKDLFNSLIYYWVHRSLHLHLELEKEMNSFSSVIYSIVKLANKEDVVADYNSISKFWSEIREILANCSRPFPSLTAAMLCKNVAQKYENEIELEDSATSLEVENIEILSQENVEWSLLIGKLEDVSLLNIIVSNHPQSNDCPLPKLKHDPVDVSLKYVLENGKGSVSELVAKWLTKAGINPINLVINDYIFNKSQEEDADIPESPKKSDDRDSPEIEEIQYTDDEIEKVKNQSVFDHLNRLRSQFPYSLEASILLANMGWEYALAWQKDIQVFKNLEAALTCLENIPNVKIKNGLYILLWNTHLKIVYESVCKLINKVGKLPKERLCRQDTGLSDGLVTIFTRICTDFFDTFIDVVELNHREGKFELHFEPIWENGGSKPLVQLAVEQRNVNYDLLHLHYQLSMTMQMLTVFSVKHSKPVHNLFDASIVPLFFSDLQSGLEISANRTDLKINASRNQFLTKIISASLECITVNENDQIYSAEHVKWMSRCLHMARIWNLDVDALRRYQVVQLYLSGYDSLADELLPAVNDRKTLGPELLNVAAKRMSQYLTISPNLSENIAAFSPALTRYFEGLNGEWCASTSLHAISTLVGQAFMCISEDEYEFKIAYQLVEACKTLLESQT